MIERSRAEIRAVLDRSDDRVLVVVGPCSAHDPAAALDYAGRLAAVGLRQDLLLVMRAYTQRAPTAAAWTEPVSEPGMSGSHDIHRGLRTARRLFLDIVTLGMPVGCEWPDPVTPQYLADAVTWGAIGARTTESQVHRQFVSGLPMPVGFGNGTDGDVQVAVDACRAAAAKHTFFGITPDGAAAIATSCGNPDCHVILRGGRSGPNYKPAHVAKALILIEDAGLPPRVMVDAGHGNSGTDDRRQPHVAAVLADQIAAGAAGLTGVMLGSSLYARRGVADCCMDFDATVAVLETLASAVRQRRRSLNPLRRAS